MPGLCETGCNGSGGQTAGSEKDLTPSTKIMVERIYDEGSTVRIQQHIQGELKYVMFHLHQTGCQEDDCVDDTNDPMPHGQLDFISNQPSLYR